jgi:MFS family permease
MLLLSPYCRWSCKRSLTILRRNYPSPLTRLVRSNIAATIVAPGILGLVADFEVTSITIGILAVSIYLLGFALGPLFISSFSEMYGRLVVYHTCNVIFVAFIIGCALSKNISQFMVFRFISGFAGAAPLTIGGGTIADCVHVEKRGMAAALFGLGPLLGPVG